MKTMNPRLLAHFKSGLVTVCNLWKVLRADGRLYAFTDLDRDVVYDDGTGDGPLTYLAGSGFTASAVKASADMSVDNLTVQGAISHDVITERDVKVGLWDGAKIWILRVNYEDLTMGHYPVRVGTMGQIKSGSQSFETELRGLTQAAQSMVGRIYTPYGTLDLDLDSLSKSGTVSLLDPAMPDVAFFDPSIASDDGYFNNGLITFTSGANAGFKSEVMGYTSADNRIRLYVRLPYLLAVGDAYTIVPGVDGTEDSYKKFNAYDQYNGFPDIPGPDSLIKGPDSNAG